MDKVINKNNVRLLVSDTPINVSVGTALTDIPASVSVKASEGELVQNGLECIVFYSDGIMPQYLRRPVYATTVSVDTAGKITEVGASSDYSPYDYAIDRFIDSPSAVQLSLYRSLLDYGAAAQSLFISSDDIQAMGGRIDEYYLVETETYLDGAGTIRGSERRYSPYDVLVANSLFGTAKARFAGFTLEDGTELVSEDKNAFSLSLDYKTLGAPGKYKIKLNYSSTLGVFNTFDTLTEAEYRNILNAPISTSQTESGGYAYISGSGVKIGTQKNEGLKAQLLHNSRVFGTLFVSEFDFTLDTNYMLSKPTSGAWIASLSFFGGFSSSSTDSLFELKLVTIDGESFMIGDTSFEVGKKVTIRVEYSVGDSFTVYADGKPVYTATARNILFMNGVALATPTVKEMKTDRATPADVRVDLTVDNLFAASQTLQGSSYKEFRYSFDDVDSVSAVVDSKNTNVSLDKQYSTTGGGYSTLVTESSGDKTNKYIEAGRGSGANEVNLAIKNTADVLPDVWIVEFDFKVDDITVRSSKSQNTWPLRIRFGGSSDSTSFANVLINYNKSTDKMTCGDASFALGEWARFMLVYDRADSSVHAYINGAECEITSYDSYKENAESFPYIIFNTRGYSDSAADDLTTSDVVESASVPRYSSIRYCVDNIVIGAFSVDEGEAQ